MHIALLLYAPSETKKIETERRESNHSHYTSIVGKHTKYHTLFHDLFICYFIQLVCLVIVVAVVGFLFSRLYPFWFHAHFFSSFDVPIHTYILSYGNMVVSEKAKRKRRKKNENKIAFEE